MGGAFIAFLISVFFIAVFTRDSYAFILFYLFAGAFIISRWWTSRTAAAVTFQRQFERHAFPGENISVQLTIQNHSRLPIIWLHLQESLPLEISNLKVLRRVLSLPSKGADQVHYQLTPQKRGYYPIGPIQLSTGDLLGLAGEKTIQGERDYLTVYPTVIPLTKVSLPSYSPLGDLRTIRPIYEDPSRSIGKRDYQPGDSLRRIDWKSSAAVGRLQTRLFEPSIALETVLFLNLNTEEYHLKFRYNATELAIVVAASLATWILGRKQSAGLFVNGSDPLAETGLPRPLPTRKGRQHLMRLLETLARVQMVKSESFEQVLRRNRAGLNWGTTIIAITGQAEDSLFDEIFQVRRSGLNLVLILCGEVIGIKDIKARAEHFKIPFFHFRDEKDLDVWRK